jgi:hypothetical protein
MKLDKEAITDAVRALETVSTCLGRAIFWSCDEKQREVLIGILKLESDLNVKLQELLKEG